MTSVRMRKALLALCMTGLFYGCRNMTSVEGVTLRAFEAVHIESANFHDSVRADGFEGYVRQHGTEGWLVGLADGRPVSEAVIGDNDKAIKISRQEGSHENGLVKDVFYYYYLRQPWAAAGLTWRPSESRQERDQAILRTIAEINRRQ